MLDTFSFGTDRATVLGIYDLASFALSEVEHKKNIEEKDSLICAVMKQAYEDVEAYHQRDPGVKGRDILCLLSPHSTFFAVLCHRLANHLVTFDREMKLAFHLHYLARSKTGVEIHPEAHIGKRFIIDHGWGTVIGQTTSIGDDCYILNNVTLGGRSISNAPSGKRHPNIGNRVQISGRAKIFGPVNIGDDCFIGPDVEVTENIPTRTKVLSGDKKLTLSPIASRNKDPGYV